MRNVILTGLECVADALEAGIDAATCGRVSPRFDKTVSTWRYHA